MVQIEVRFYGQEISYYLTVNQVIRKKRKIKVKYKNSYYEIADTFDHADQTYPNKIVINDVFITDDFKKLAGVPEEVETSQALYISIMNL